MKKYIKAKELLETKANRKEKKPIYATRKLSIGLVSCMLGLAMATPMVHAEGDQVNILNPQIEEASEPADGGVEDSETNDTPVPLEKDDTSQEGSGEPDTQDADVFEMGPEIVSEPVTKINVKAPTVNDVLYDATTISGANLAKAKVQVGKKKQTVIATVHVTLKDKDGTVKATLSDSPTKGTTWSVKLPEGKKVEEGDTVTVYQQIGEDKSPEVTANAQPSKADTVTLTMPTGEFWIEEYVGNIVNADEKAEAIDLLKKANPTIANDIKSVEFEITGIDTKTASYKVIYTDNSETEEIQAPSLTIKQVTETSRSPEIESITVVDNVVKGKLAGPGPFDGIKVQLIIDVNKNKADKYCNENKCTVDKDSSKPVGVTLQDDGTFSYTLQAGESLKLDQIVGVSVKEPHKFVSCSTTTVKPVKVEKKEVRDPRKLTADEKKAIDAAIRKAYIVNGVSKLPDGNPGTNWEGIPAVIQIDDSGNVKIFSASDVEVTFDSNYNVIPGKNADGSYKLKDGAEAKITIQGKDLVKNIKPEPPTLALSKDKKSITITPNLGENEDTDTKTINVTYKDKDGKEQTTTATKDDNGTWSITKGEGSVDQKGVVSLPKDKVKGGTDVTATVTDKGGVAEDDKDPLTSEPGTLPVKETKADKVEALGGLDPVVMKKWVGDTVDWKEGVKAKNEANKDKVAELLKGATFEDIKPDEHTPERNTDKASGKNGFQGNIKVKFDDGSEIIVENQILYVSDFITSSTNENAPTDAIEVEFKLGEGVKVEDKDPNSGKVLKTTEGDKNNPVLYKKYKIKPNTDLSIYKNPTLGKTIFELINETEKDGYTEPVWNDDNKGTNFVVNANNKTFISTATQLFEVTFDSNGGDGSMEGAKVKANNTYTLPENKFTPATGKKFDGWKVGNDSKIRKAGETITITDSVVITANWIDDKVTKVRTEVIKAKIKYEADGTLEFGKQKVIKEAVNGEKEITTVSQKGKDDIVTKKTTKEKVDGLVKIGNKKVEVKKDGDITITTTTTYEVNPNTGELINPKVEVKKTTQPKPIEDIAKTTKVTKEVIKAKTKYETDDTLEFGKQKVIKEAVNGEKEITTVSQKGKDDIVTKKTTKEKVDGLVKIGNKKVEVKKDGDITITTTTTYEVNPNTGELINPKVVVKKSMPAKLIEDIAKTNPETPQPGTETETETPGTGIDTPDNNTPGTNNPKENDPSKDKPAEPGKDNPTDPAKPGENPEKPSDKEPGKEKDKNEEGKKPGVEDRLRIRYNPNGGHWNDNSTDIITYYYDRGNIITLINQPTREGYRFLYWKGSAYQPGDKYTVVDDHMFVAQWEKIGTKASRSNPKTGIESAAGVVCTLVASTGALYIGRKKED